MYRESDIANFNSLFNQYSNLYGGIESSILNQSDSNNFVDLEKVRSQFNFFDIKLRLAFAINQINLNQDYMQRKEEDLQLCHLMLYKFNDLWFAYEAFTKLYNELNHPSIQSLTLWLSLATYENYLNLQEIEDAVSRANSELNHKFNNPLEREKLQDYIQYCHSKSTRGQTARLNTLIGKTDMRNNIILLDLDITDWLSLSYAVRNNFVHNGETTITTPELDYSKKKDLLIVLYELLAIILLRVSIKMIEDKIAEY